MSSKRAPPKHQNKFAWRDDAGHKKNEREPGGRFRPLAEFQAYVIDARTKSNGKQVWQIQDAERTCEMMNRKSPGMKVSIPVAENEMQSKEHVFDNSGCHSDSEDEDEAFASDTDE